MDVPDEMNLFSVLLMFQSILICKYLSLISKDTPLQDWIREISSKFPREKLNREDSEALISKSSGHQYQKLSVSSLSTNTCRIKHHSQFGNGTYCVHCFLRYVVKSFTIEIFDVNTSRDGKVTILNFASFTYLIRKRERH